jgi:DNA-directed RNA polymerase specialized sigma24 family protein
MAATAITDTAVKYFFFFSFDEQLSFSASLKVLAELKANNRIEAEHREYWVQMLHKWKPKVRNLRPRPWSDSPVAKGFVVPAEFDLTVWVSFLNAAEADQIEAVLLSRILGFSDIEIAGGLGITVGTVRYRVGHGLRRLGGFVES